MVKREFQARYLSSVLGSVWAIAQPLTLVIIYTAVFGQLMHARLPGVDDSMAYGIFLCAGVLTWSMFAEVVTRCVQVFVEHANLIKKMSFPRATLPAVVLLSAALNFAIVFGILLAFLAVVGRFPGWPVLALIPLLVLQQGLALGVGVALGVVNVFFRDVAHAVAIVLQLWFWFTPIVYPAQLPGERVRQLLGLNPLTRMVSAYQEIVLNGRWPEWSQFSVHFALAGIVLLAALVTFRRLSSEMGDYL
jgi:lipopolysaccharide transport system permease protein